MSTQLESKSVNIQDAAATADDLHCVLLAARRHDVWERYAGVEGKAADDLLWNDDPDVLQLGYLLYAQAVLRIPADELGRMVHTTARSIAETLAEGMPMIDPQSRVEHVREALTISQYDLERGEREERWKKLPAPLKRRRHAG